MPMFVHPRNEIDLTPRPEFVALTGGEAHYQSITAGAYLHQRLVEIGLAEPEGDKMNNLVERLCESINAGSPLKYNRPPIVHRWRCDEDHFRLNP